MPLERIDISQFNRLVEGLIFRRVYSKQLPPCAIKASVSFSRESVRGTKQKKGAARKLYPFLMRRKDYFLALALVFLVAFFGAFTASLNALPAENFGTIAAGILSSAPVEGLRPVRAWR